MAKQKGSDMLLKCDLTGSGVFVTVGGIQTTRFNLRVGDADVTNQGSPSKFRELLEGAGIKQISVSGNGVFDSGANWKALRNLILNGTIRNWQLIVPGDAIYQVAMQVTQLEHQGPHDKAVSASISLESAGAPTVTDL